jgi:signal transduction histidine kinase
MTLRRRLTLAFVACALVAATCFSFLGVMFVYTVEDHFFDRILEQQVPDVRRYRDRGEFPADLARQLTADVQRGEYYGDAGRHYHVRKTADGYLVAEVSKQLVVRPRLASILAILGSMALVLAFVVGGIGYLFARRATAPLERLAALLDASGPAQLPNGFSVEFKRDEVGMLAQALDAAMIRVADFIEREQHFTRDASHELRTPIAIIDGAAALMEAEQLSPAGRAQLHRIRDACALMQRTTETLLLLSRESGAADVRPVRLLPMVEASIVRHAPALDSKELEVEVDIPPDAALPLPEGVLEILLANIIGNAVAHSTAGRIAVSYSGGALMVSNRGDIPDGLREAIFDQGVKRPGSEGHGLGLAIAQRLAQRFGFRLALSLDGDRVTMTLAGGGDRGLPPHTGPARSRSG